MPGSTGADEEDGDLDQSFRADKIEFLVMSRNITEAERDGEMVIEEVGDVDWDIPTRDDFEDVMGLVFEPSQRKSRTWSTPSSGPRWAVQPGWAALWFRPGSSAT